jgi:hypothetical protein
MPDIVPIDQEIDAYIAHARQLAEGGLTVSEVGDLLTGAILVATHAAEGLALPGADKRAIVQAAVAAVFDSVAGFAVPAPLYPFWLLARPLVRSLVIAAAGGAIDRLLPLVRENHA